MRRWALAIKCILVKGDAVTHTAEVVAEGVECPSLSPDNRRIAYKKRVYDGGRLLWRLAVLELVDDDRRRHCR